MDFSDSTTQYTAGLSLLALTAGFLLFQPTGFVKWLQKKNYQYEVTFSLYMLTPTEKFVFSTFHYPLPIPIYSTTLCKETSIAKPPFFSTYLN